MMNLFARALGGMSSDYMFQKMGVYGRIILLFTGLACTGILLVLFSASTDLGVAIVVLVLLSILTQASEGATFALVPYVNKQQIGAVAGLVGAGGNLGAVVWSSILKETDTLAEGMYTVGWIIIVASCLVLCVTINNQNILRRLLNIEKKTNRRTKEQILQDLDKPIEREGVDSSSIARALYPNVVRNDFGKIETNNQVTAMYPSGKAWLKSGTMEEYEIEILFRASSWWR
jgi:MFS family permease